MNTKLVEAIANVVLYEGYMLYPYRPSSVKNRQRTMVGQLGYDPTGRGISARRYIEKSFIAGRLEQTTTSTCTCAASATEKASEQCSGAEPSGALRQ